MIRPAVNLASGRIRIQRRDHLAGETYSATGSFTDPGADSWTGAVDFGSRAAALTLTGLQNSGAIPAATASDLTKTLPSASESLATKDNASGTNQLGAFKNKVNAAQRSNKISTATAQALTAMADRIIASATR